MKRFFRLIIRIIVTLAIFALILFFINEILTIKYMEKENDNLSNDWDWVQENKVLDNLLRLKYPDQNDKNWNVVMNRYDDIPKKMDNEKRILVVGDSFIYGYGGNNVNYTWWKQLNQQIKEAGYSNVNVYGAGIIGYNTEMELNLILKNDDLINRIDPDLIIIGYVTNDSDHLREDSLKEDWEINVETHPIYKKNPNLYYELVDRMNSLGADNEKQIRELGDLLGFYRWDIRRLMLTEGVYLDYYKNILEQLDARINEIGVPYFFLQTDHFDLDFVRRANSNMYSFMDGMGIKIYHDLDPSKVLELIGSSNRHDLDINPYDSHPGIAWTTTCGKYAFEILKKDYSFLFENAKMQDINELDLNINDTMPSLKVKKITKNVFEFEYPASEKIRTIESNFLYYPIEKNYIKLNLEYPKDVSKIIITGNGLKDAEVYVNTIDPKYGFDIDDEFLRVTACNYIGNNTYQINKKITSVNIVANFKNADDRKLKIEFIEE